MLRSPAMHLMVCFATLALTCTPAWATLTVSAAVGGAPSGASHADFDNLALGDGGGTTGGVTVGFSGTGQAVRGSSSGYYAAPFLSSDNGALFGDPMNGPDGTTYLSTGIGSVTLRLPGNETNFGLLWGSVDAYNSLSFYQGATLLGTITGPMVTANPDGDQGIDGTYYVNIDSSRPFDRVVASSTQYAFEFDNVAYRGTAVPGPASIAVLVAGLIGLATARRKPARSAKTGRSS